MFLLSGFIQIPGVSVVAGCDVYEIKRKRFEKRVADYYMKNGINAVATTCEDYRELLQRDDVDAVVIAVPAHSHAIIAIAACNAGKDIYLEKPLTFTIKEGRELVRAVRARSRILAVGSQQR
jgi:predicted dehydrogenase